MKQATLYAARMDSSVIKGVWYDHQTELLRIEFRTTGTTWEYEGVRPYEVGRFLSSHSPGRYFNNHIRNHYNGKKVSADEQEKMALRNSPARP